MRIGLVPIGRLQLEFGTHHRHFDRRSAPPFARADNCKTSICGRHLLRVDFARRHF